jgi:hypothetical protein
MKNFKFKDCDVTITNNTKYVSDRHCKIFVTKYLSYYLAKEYFGNHLFIPYEIKNKTPLNIDVIENDDKIQMYINNHLHIELNINDYHNMQLCCEQNGRIHGLFFSETREMKHSGLELLKLIRFVKSHHEIN